MSTSTTTSEMSPSTTTSRLGPAPGLRKARLTTLIFALAILIPSGYGFGKKFLELLALTRGDVDGVFAISPVVNYLLASLGFFCLFCWAISNGMFGDIEQPKWTMLQTERMLDDLDLFEEVDAP